MAAPQYEIINMSVSDLDRIDLPRFQRRFVWNRRKKESFITTLHEGLPFGAVLVYPKSKDPDAPLLILDGQQRLSTIREFRANPLIYWKSLEHDEYVLQLRNVNECLPEEKELQEKDFDSLLEEQDDALDDWLDDIDDKISRKRVRAIIRQTKNLMSSYINLDSLKIPAIEFRGSRERIADVFANLNQGGVPLSKYEIYNAAWVHTEIHLDKSKLQESILWNVKQHYANMSQKTNLRKSEL